MTATYGTISNTTYTGRVNTTITAPTGIANGNFLFLAHITAGSGVAVTQTLPAGFTQIGTTQTGSDGSFGYSFIQGYKIAASESGNYTVTHASSNSMGVMVRITGTNTLAIDVSSQASGNGGTMTGSSVTPTQTDDLLFFVAINWNLDTLTAPTGMTTRLQSALIYIATQALVSSAATGTRVTTQTGGVQTPWVSNLIAIKDTTGGATPKTQVNVAGTWKPATTFVKVAGVWKPASPFVKVAGVWKPL